MSCQICLETIEKKDNLKKQISRIKFQEINCYKCSAISCSSCLKQFLLSDMHDPRCFSCKTVYPRSFLCQKLGSIFVNKELAKHREDILVDKEKSKLTFVQERISFFKDNVPIINNLIKEVRLFFNELIKKEKDIYDNFKFNFKGSTISKKHKLKPSVKKSRDLMLININNLSIKKESIINILNNVKSSIVSYGNNLTEIKPIIPKLHIIDSDIKIEYNETKNLLSDETVKGHCPMNECRGYITKGNKCGICNTHICIKCFKEIHSVNSEFGPHVCIKEDVLSVSSIKKDCVNCPKCRTSIFRIDGCNQMWCTLCHTVFDYRNGLEIKNGAIHNPHYTEFLKSNPTLNYDCNNGVFDIRLFDNKEFRSKYGHFEISQLNYIYRSAVEFVNLLDDVDNKEKKRLFKYNVDYLLNNITYDIYKKRIQRCEKEFSKLREVNMVKTLWAQITLDILFQFCNNKSYKDLKKLLNNNTNILKVSCKDIETHYNSSVSVSLENMSIK